MLANSGFIVHYEQTDATLKLDVEQGNVDVAWRSLSPTDVASLQTETSKVKVVQGNGIEIRYLVFNTKLAPFNNPSVRQAIAYLIDRNSIAKNVYNGTVSPLWSMVPVGLTGATSIYKDTYGATPDPTKAKALLTAAGFTAPIPITIWWTPTHYGAVSGDEYTEIARELNASGLFKVTLQSAEWDTYSKAYSSDQYGAYELGWFPDYPDADDYLAPFYVKGGFYNNHYDNPAIDALITQEEGESDATKRTSEIDQIQTLAAKDVPTIPVWQGNQVAATGLTVAGVEQDVRRVVHLPDVAHRPRADLTLGARSAKAGRALLARSTRSAVRARQSGREAVFRSGGNSEWPVFHSGKVQRVVAQVRTDPTRSCHPDGADPADHRLPADAGGPW